MATEKADELLESKIENQRDEGTSEAANSEVARGNNPSHTIFDNLTELDTSSPSSSSDTASTPSPSNKTSYKPDDVYVPMYPSVKERIDDMFQKTIDVS